MKSNKLYIGFMAVLGLAGVAASCTSEEPFGAMADGTLRMKMVINSEVTRADLNQDELDEKCIIYISDQRGLIRKYQGLNNMPESIDLKGGNYVAEAWTGDSVSADYEKKFYRAYEPFTINSGVTNVVLNCKIQNVVASVNPESIDSELMKDWTLTIGNSRASLDFTEENVNAEHGVKGYYMMPDGETSLTWTLKGKDIKGADFEKSGELTNVQRAHEYVFNFKYGQAEDPTGMGGAYITIVVNDEEILIEDEIMLHAAPKIKGLGFDIDATQTRPANTWDDLYLAAALYGSIKNSFVTFSDASAFGLSSAEFDLTNATSAVLATLQDAGLSWVDAYENEHSTRQYSIDKAMLNRLTNGDYWIDFGITASDGRTTTKRLNLCVSDASVAVQTIADEDINSYSATVSVDILKEDATNPGLEFREYGTSDWTTATSTRTRGTVTFRLSNLKPATKYECRAVADGYVNPKSVYFTTYDVFTIPNSSFEEWSEDTAGKKDKAMLPVSGGVATFWDSGNHGSITMSKNITNPSTAMIHSGTYSACLQSQFVGIGSIGKHAAGNIFIGEYKQTKGTNGVIDFGRPFNGTFPVAVKGWLNYRPGQVYTKTNKKIHKGDMDQGEIYIALTTEPITVDTSDTSTLFNKDSDKVIAFGNLVLTGNYGDDNQLKEFTIDFNYKAGREREKAAYLIVVASASRYGDYFEGGESTMYLDDVVLVYE